MLLKMNEYISNYYIRIKIEDIFKQDKSNNLIGNTAEEKYDYYMQYFFYNKRHMQLLVKKYEIIFGKSRNIKKNFG